MQQTATGKGINLNLEALRGFAALFVVLNHIEALHFAFELRYLPTATIVLAPNGRLFVLIFLVLSGYVMGLNHSQQMRGAEVLSYIKKRATRVYPIYFLSILFTLIISQQTYSISYILINLLMLQVLLAPTLNENGPAWSLHYEVVYYVLFIHISRFKINLVWLILISVVLALSNAGILSSYFMGLSFWLSGLYIAQRLKDVKIEVNYSKLSAGVFMLLALDQILSRPGIPELTVRLMYQLPFSNYLTDLKHSSPLIDHPEELFYLPIYAFILILFSGKKWPYTQLCFNLLNVLLVACMLLTIYQYQNGYTAHIKVYLISIAYYVLSLLFWYSKHKWFDSAGHKILKIGTWFGGISYAMYMIHAPLMYFLGRFTFWPSNHIVNYVFKLVVLFALLLPIAWVLEKQFQPYIKRKLWAKK